MNAPDAPLDVLLTVEQLWQPVPGGSGTYVRDLLGALVARPDLRMTGLAARHDAPPSEGWRLPPDVAVTSSRLPRRALYEAWSRVRLPRAGGPARPGALVHATTWAVPPARVPLVVTVHDLAFLRSPEHFTAHGNAFFRRGLEIVRREAAAVIAVSRATRDDCVRAGIPADRVHVVPHGVSHLPVTRDAVDAFRVRHGLDRPYVLWCGTVEPRKNVDGLLHAYRQVADRTDLDLVLVGPSGWGDAPDAVRDAASVLPPGRVHRLGHLAPPDLHAAYAGARAFCFPSWWEGFGMPVLEAMAHGVPVVTSGGTSMDEVAGDAGVLVDPADPDAIADALLRVTGDEHADRAARSRTRAADFTWERSAARTAEVYRAALS